MRTATHTNQSTLTNSPFLSEKAMSNARYWTSTKRRPFAERVWEKVEKSDHGCWIWLAAKTPLGYGVIGRQDRRANILAHRATYELVHGPIPVGLEIDHICRNPSCVNPSDLEPVTHAENMRRGKWLNQASSKKTHCPQGHPYSGDNLYFHINKSHPNGARHCRTCRREWGMKNRRNNKCRA
jgi:hypothetical protein